MNFRNEIQRPRSFFAKISRPEIASLMMSPPPPNQLSFLVSSGHLTQEEANLAIHLPICTDLTVEGDSGGHTDNRPLYSILPVIQNLEYQLRKKYQYKSAVRVGAAGGLGTPAAVAASFALGASYVVTGSINQAAVESTLGITGKELLSKATVSDFIMAPSAGMFELGVKVQVLKRETLFGFRANRLFQIFNMYEAIEDVPVEIIKDLESELFKASIFQIWSEVEIYLSQKNPEFLRLALSNPKQKMAAIFKWYLGQSSQWAIANNTSRSSDFQIWCGPAMGAFNDWVKDSYLQPLKNRSVVQIAKNILEGASVLSRIQQIRALGYTPPISSFDFRPRPFE